MEILIVGLIVVALMVVVSTKIKKSAAQAFEREEIETEEFSVVKPEGYICPFNENSAFAFEAYTKDFGDEAAKNFRRSRATLRVVAGSDFQTVCRNAKNVADKILSKQFVEDAPDGQKIFTLENEKSEAGVRFITRWKIVESRERRKVYEFQVSVLEEYLEDYADEASRMIASFAVK